MKFNPINKYLVGRIIITKRKASEIELTEDVSKGVSKFMLVDEVSSEAVEAGYAPGDIVLPRSFDHIFLKGGELFRGACSMDVIICKPEGLSLDEFVDWKKRPVSATPEEDAAA